MTASSLSATSFARWLAEQRFVQATGGHGVALVSE